MACPSRSGLSVAIDEMAATLSLKSVLEDWDKQTAVLANTLFFLISPYSPTFNPSKHFFSDAVEV